MGSKLEAEVLARGEALDDPLNKGQQALAKKDLEKRVGLLSTFCFA